MGFWINLKLFCCLSLVLVTEQRNIVKRELEEMGVLKTPQKYIIDPVQTPTTAIDENVNTPYDAVDLSEDEKLNEIENKDGEIFTGNEGGEQVVNKNCENDSNDLQENNKELNIKTQEFSDKLGPAEKFEPVVTEEPSDFVKLQTNKDNENKVVQNEVQFIKNTKAEFSETVDQELANKSTKNEVANFENFEQTEKNESEPKTHPLEIDTRVEQHQTLDENEKVYYLDVTTAKDSENLSILSDAGVRGTEPTTNENFKQHFSNEKNLENLDEDFDKNHIVSVKITHIEENENESQDAEATSHFPTTEAANTDEMIQENDITITTTTESPTHETTESGKAAETLSSTSSLETRNSTTTTAKPIVTRRPFINRRPTRRPLNSTNPGWFANFPLIPPGLFFPTFFLNPFNTTFSANNQTQTTFGFGIFTLPTRWRPNLASVFRPVPQQTNATRLDSGNSLWSSLLGNGKSANKEKESETASYWTPWNYLTGNEISKSSNEKSQPDASAVNTQVLHLYFPLRYPFQGQIIKQSSVNAKAENKNSETHIVKEQKDDISDSPNKLEKLDVADLNKLKSDEKASLKFEFELPKPIAKFVKGVLDTFMPQQN